MTTKIRVTCDEDSLLECLGTSNHNIVERVVISQEYDLSFEAIFPDRLVFELRLLGVYDDFVEDLMHLTDWFEDYLRDLQREEYRRWHETEYYS